MVISGFFVLRQQQNQVVPRESYDIQEATLNNIPTLQARDFLTGLQQPWDVAIAENSDVFFTEKAGAINRVSADIRTQFKPPSGLNVKGEAGLMGLVLDPGFAANGQIYACYAYADTVIKDIRITRWRVDGDQLTNEKTIISGLPYNDSTFPGRHSGCRIRFGSDNNLWVGTGDAAIGTNPQDPKSLGGKILRITADGDPVGGNLQSPFDTRIYSYGHRNVQGLAMFDEPANDSYGFSAEHGSDRDDEVNELIPGNFGWDPIPGYNEAVSMTDSGKYPGAIDAFWTSGQSTIAVSGADVLLNPKWGSYRGSVVLAVQKDMHIRRLSNNDGKLGGESVFFDGVGRVRSVVEAPNGDLYVTTDNKRSNDKIVIISP